MTVLLQGWLGCLTVFRAQIAMAPLQKPFRAATTVPLHFPFVSPHSLSSSFLLPLALYTKKGHVDIYTPLSLLFGDNEVFIHPASLQFSPPLHTRLADNTVLWRKRQNYRKNSLHHQRRRKNHQRQSPRPPPPLIFLPLPLLCCRFSLWCFFFLRLSLVIKKKKTDYPWCRLLLLPQQKNPPPLFLYQFSIH